jgi:hypothetical protein
MSDSIDLIKCISLLFMDYFNLCYPLMPKDKLKQLLVAYSKNASPSSSSLPSNNNSNNLNSQENDEVEIEDSSLSFIIKKLNNNNKNDDKLYTIYQFDKLIVPFFLPKLSEDEKNNNNEQNSLNFYLNEIRIQMEQKCLNTIKTAQEKNLISDDLLKTINSNESYDRNEPSKYLPIPILKHTFSFPWKMMNGIFEKFSVQTILNSDLYFKEHFKNAIHSFNEENSIG